jgi:hypothetical protein
MLTRTGSFWYHGEKWIPETIYVFPTVCIIKEHNPVYWRVEFRWLRAGVDWEWWPKK